MGWGPALAVSFVAAASGWAGCSDDGGAEPPGPAETCPDQVDGVCVGVTQGTLCASDGCTGDVTCASVTQASDDATLASALSSAAPGSCVTLAGASYAAVAVPPGVSLLGRGADLVDIAGLTLSAGDGAVLQGMAVGAGGLVIEGASGVHVRQVRVEGAAGVGIDLTAGSTATLTNVEILAAGQVALRSVDAGDVTVQATWISGALGPGIVDSCTAGCGCATGGAFSASAVVVRQATHVGAYFHGRPAALEGVLIDGTQVDGLSANSGGGLSASGCAALSSQALIVSNNDYFGLLVDDASASFVAKPGAVGDAPEKGIIIHDNVIGAWLSNVGASGGGGVTLDGVTIRDSQGVGLGVSPESKGIIIHDMQIRDTVSKTLPIGGGGAEDVGDGLLWGSGAQISIDGLAVSGSARQSILIDEAFGEDSSLAHISLSDGDEQKGIVQQSYEDQSPDPTLGPGVPSIQTVPDQVYALPVPPASPSAS